MSPRITNPRIHTGLVALILLLCLAATSLGAAETSRSSAALPTTRGRFVASPFSGRLWYTRVFVRRDGRWQAVAMQHTMIQ